MRNFWMRNLLLFIIAALLLAGGIFAGVYLSRENTRIKPVVTSAADDDYYDKDETKTKITTQKARTFNGDVVEKNDLTVAVTVPSYPAPPVHTDSNHHTVSTTVSHVTEAHTTKKQAQTTNPSTTKSPYPVIRIPVQGKYTLDTSSLPKGAPVTFRSSSATVAGVNDSGIITGRSKGESIVSVTYKINMKNYTNNYLVVVY